MANIDFTHKTIENQTAGISVSKTTFQSLFDAVRKIVDKSYRGSTEKLDADLLAGVVPGAGGLAALAKAATIWASDNDGNGGQPPAPKPTVSAVIGNVAQLSSGAGNALVLPSGGAWWYWYTGYRSSDGTFYTGSNLGIDAGGSTIQSAIAGVNYIGWAWRIA